MTNPVALLRTDLGEALVMAGFALHDCIARSPIGGVCLTPATISPYEEDAGLIVTWGTTESLRDDGGASYQAVLDRMNAALADVVAALGFEARPFGRAGATLVMGRRSSVERPDDFALDQIR